MPSIPESHLDLLIRPRYIELRCDVISTSETGALDHRDRLDAASIGPDHHSDPVDDSTPRVIVTLEAMEAHAHG